MKETGSVKRGIREGVIYNNNKINVRTLYKPSGATLRSAHIMGHVIDNVSGNYKADLMLFDGCLLLEFLHNSRNHSPGKVKLGSAFFVNPFNYL